MDPDETLGLLGRMAELRGPIFGRQLTQSPIADLSLHSALINIFVAEFYPQAEAQLDLSRGDFIVMHSLWCGLGQPVLAQQIVQATAIPKNTISRTIHSLVRRGYVTLLPSPGDRREKPLMLSDEGAWRFSQALKLAAALQERALSVLEPDERDLLRRLVAKVIGGFPSALQGTEPPEPPEGLPEGN